MLQQGKLQHTSLGVSLDANILELFVEVKEKLRIAWSWNYFFELEKSVIVLLALFFHVIVLAHAVLLLQEKEFINQLFILWTNFKIGNFH